jgi:hypothetical protein
VAQANTVAKIERILLYEDGNIMYIYPVGGVQNAPACHDSNGNYISYKMNRPMAKEYLSLLMTAFVAKKTVTFRTAGDCIDQSVSDTLFYFSVSD